MIASLGRTLQHARSITRSKIPTVLISAIALLPNLALADSSPGYTVYSEKFRRCMDKSGGITSEVLDCNSWEFSRSTSALNLVYKQAMAKIDKNDRHTLRHLQARWRSHLDTECENDPALDAVEGGSAASIVYSDCLISKTKARTKWIKRRYLHQKLP